MNRTFKIIVSIVVCVWIFAMGLELGAYRERKAINTALMASSVGTSTTSPTVTPAATDPTTTAQQEQPSEQPTQQPSEQPTQQPSEEQSEQPSEQQSEQPSEQPSSDNTDATVNNDDVTEDTQNTSKKPKTTEEIVKAFNDAVNNTKNAQQNCNASQDTNVEVHVDDCSVPKLTGMVNSIVQGFSGPEHNDYAFINSVTSDGVRLYDNLPPSSKDCTLTAAGVLTASSEDYGNGGYKLTITLAPETSTLDTPPVNHAASVGYLDLAALGIKGVNFTEANFNYPGATVIVCVNEKGLLDSYESQFPLNGTGTAKVTFASGTATISGSMTEKWVFTWA